MVGEQYYWIHHYHPVVILLSATRTIEASAEKGELIIEEYERERKDLLTTMEAGSPAGHALC